MVVGVYVSKQNRSESTCVERTGAAPRKDSMQSNTAVARTTSTGVTLSLVSDSSRDRTRRKAIADLDWYFGCHATIMGLEGFSYVFDNGVPQEDSTSSEVMRANIARATQVYRELARLDPLMREVLRETFEPRPWDTTLRSQLQYRQTTICLAWVAARVPASIHAMIAAGRAREGSRPSPYAVSQFLAYEARANRTKMFEPIRRDAVNAFHMAAEAFASVRS